MAYVMKKKSVRSGETVISSHGWLARETASLQVVWLQD
jgi:hypothetical protein